MAEETKKYSVVGTVQIGADEYRDLVESNTRNEHDASQYRSKYWGEQNRVSDLETKLKAAKDALASYEAFIASEESIREAYKNYFAKQAMQKLLEEEEEN